MSRGFRVPSNKGASNILPSTSRQSRLVPSSSEARFLRSSRRRSRACFPSPREPRRSHSARCRARNRPDEFGRRRVHRCDSRPQGRRGVREARAQGPRRDQIVALLRFFSQKCTSRVDGPFSVAILLTPPEAGLPTRSRTGCVLAYFGTANWNSILSRHDERKRHSSRKTGLGFFVN